MFLTRRAVGVMLARDGVIICSLSHINLRTEESTSNSSFVRLAAISVALYLNTYSNDIRIEWTATSGSSAKRVSISATSLITLVWD